MLKLRSCKPIAWINVRLLCTLINVLVKSRFLVVKKVGEKTNKFAIRKFGGKNVRDWKRDLTKLPVD